MKKNQRRASLKQLTELANLLQDGTIDFETMRAFLQGQYELTQAPKQPWVKIDILELSVRITKRLREANIESVVELSGKTMDALTALGLDEKSCEEVYGSLYRVGFRYTR